MSTTTVSSSAQVRNRARNGATRKRCRPEVGFRYIVAVLAIVFAAFPIVYVISASLSEGGTLTGSNELFGTISGANYVALSDTRFWQWVVNTLIIGSSAAVGTVLMGGAAAYAFSRFRFKDAAMPWDEPLGDPDVPAAARLRRGLPALAEPGEVVPALGLNSRLALICVYLGGALGVNTFLMYGFFNTVPRSWTRRRRSMGLRTPRFSGRSSAAGRARSSQLSGCCPSSVRSPTSCWRSLFSSLRRSIARGGPHQWVSDQLSANWGLFAAGSCISAIPVVLLFLFLQKYIVSGSPQGPSRDDRSGHPWCGSARRAPAPRRF